MAQGVIRAVVNAKAVPVFYECRTHKSSRIGKNIAVCYGLMYVEYEWEVLYQALARGLVSDMMFARLTLHIRAVTIANCQELSMQYLYGDEVWRWDKILLREFLGRHHNRWNRKVFLASQAGNKNDAMDMS